MKQFVREVSQEWRQLRYFPKYRYTPRNGKYFVRRLLIIANKEASAIFIHLFNNPFSIVVVMVAVGLAIFVPNLIGKNDIVGFLNIISGFIISFISVLVAAAIFISTLHRQSSNKSVEEDIKFLTSIK